MCKERTYRHNDGLVISCGGHTAAAVASSSQPTIDRGGKEALTISLVVDTLEEGEFLWVGRVRAIDDLAGDVSVANNVPTLKGLGSGVICRVRVGERASCEVVDLDGDVESLISLNVVAVSGVLERCSNHVAGARDLSHD